ncbi:MAG TPA: PilZ domain-containing protein [Planctomycetota bacterium]|jgi:Tfp pilus assembly protein PilZ|nr:PilZ domain-containing protein [Planctomycetota bacterium]
MAEPLAESPRPPEHRKDAPSDGVGKPARQELRRHLRFRIDDASAKLYIKGFLTSIGLGKVNKARAAINLSEGGTLLLTFERIAPGTKVVVRIDMERFEDVIDVDGVVKWCEQSGKSDKDWYAGIEFSGLDGGDSKKIARMREWFTSPEYKTRTATRRRMKASGS